MKAIINWIKNNPQISTLLVTIFCAIAPVIFGTLRRIYSRLYPPIKIRYQDSFSWFSMFGNEDGVHIVILLSPELVNNGDKSVSVRDIRLRYMLVDCRMSSEIRPVTLPLPPAIDMGDGHAKVYPVFFTHFPTVEVVGANITQSGDIPPFGTQAGFLLFIEHTEETGTPLVEADRLKVEICVYPEGMSPVSSRGQCSRLRNSTLETLVPGLSDYQALRQNLGSVDRFG